MKLLFKRQSLAYILCFTLTLLLFSCSTSNDELDETQSIESQLEFKSVSHEELNALIQIQKQDEVQSQSRNGFFSRRGDCEQENFQIFWIGDAELNGINDPIIVLEVRSRVRLAFQQSHALITSIGAFPETNTELWIFNHANNNDDRSGCKGDSVRAAVDTNPSTANEEDQD
ncbi:hypothetical protein [uncultured Dokdonia sp.]|uniref:hypothetical protein n=1 Tax=uncultured Dokdonia sp. TaxID=575653 RepID=UPI00260C865A|nr:hypothetical protein [uncultured Dokdonia sp.]